MTLNRLSKIPAKSLCAISALTFAFSIQMTTDAASNSPKSPSQSSAKPGLTREKKAPQKQSQNRTKQQSRSIKNPNTTNKAKSNNDSMKNTISADSNAPLQVNLVISEPCSLITFLDCICDRPHTTSWVKDWYFDHRAGDLSKERALLATYKTLVLSTSEHECIDETGRQQNFNQQLLSLAAQCESLTELLAKLKKLTKPEEFKKLKSVLEHFDAVYRALVWEPRLEGLQNQQRLAQIEMEKGKLSERLEQVRKFMKAPWVPGVPFTIVLVPLPETKTKNRNSHGECLGKVQIVELFPFDKAKTKLDVVFHEACHAIWHTRKDLDTVKADFESTEGGDDAYAELNEGMATALGQGWFSKMAFGKTQKNWYTDPITNGYGRALYPLLTEYLKNNKPMDAEFANRATKLFKKKFPNALDSPNLTSNFEIFSDELTDIENFNQSIQNAFPRLHSLSTHSPLNNAQSLSAFRESKAKHVAILLTPDKVNSLLEWGVPAEKCDSLRETKEAVSLKVGNKAVVFCIAANSTKQQEILFTSLAKGHWPKLLN